MSKINLIEGKTFLYMAQEIKVVSVQHQEDDIYKITCQSGREIFMSEEEIRIDLLPVIDQNQEIRRLSVVESVMDANNQMADITAILMDNIKKVSENPDFIDQAKSINESVKNIIDIKKTQVDAIRVAKDFLL